MTQGLDLVLIYKGPFQPKPFFNSMIKALLPDLKEYRGQLKKPYNGTSFQAT